MKHTYEIVVRGRSGAEYGFNFKGHPEHVEGWRDEGFEINEVFNSIPLWAHHLGLTRVWFATQDAWRFLRMW